MRDYAVTARNDAIAVPNINQRLARGPVSDVGKRSMSGLDELSHLLLLVPLNWHARLFEGRE